MRRRRARRPTPRTHVSSFDRRTPTRRTRPRRVTKGRGRIHDVFIVALARLDDDADDAFYVRHRRDARGAVVGVHQASARARVSGGVTVRRAGDTGAW